MELVEIAFAPGEQVHGLGLVALAELQIGIDGNLGRVHLLLLDQVAPDTNGRCVAVFKGFGVVVLVTIIGDVGLAHVDSLGPETQRSGVNFLFDQLETTIKVVQATLHRCGSAVELNRGLNQLTLDDGVAVHGGDCKGICVRSALFIHCS